MSYIQAIVPSSPMCARDAAMAIANTPQSLKPFCLMAFSILSCFTPNILSISSSVSLSTVEYSVWKTTTSSVPPIVVATIQWLPRVCMICKPLKTINRPGLLLKSRVDISPWMLLNCFLSNDCAKLKCLSFNFSPVAMILRSSSSNLTLFIYWQPHWLDRNIIRSSLTDSNCCFAVRRLLITTYMCSFVRLSVARTERWHQ